MELDLNVVSFTEAIIRTGLALLFGLVIGIERDTKDKPIDFRAYMIVALTTCIIAIMGQELYFDYSSAKGFVSLDLGKIISGVLTGIGFLGAGAIIKVESNQIKGSATGASIWASGGMGLCVGFGMYTLAGIAFVSVIAILVIGGYLGSKVQENNK